MKKFFISQTVTFVLLYFLFGLLINPNDKWLSGQFWNLLLTTLVYIISTIIGGISYLYRPLSTNIDIYNKHYGKNRKDTTLNIEYNKITEQQKFRTFKCEFSLERKNSFWWMLLNYLCKVNDVIIKVVCRPDHIALQPFNQSGMTEISRNKERGFNIHLNWLIREFYRIPPAKPLTKTYLFFIPDHPDLPLPQISSNNCISVEVVILGKNKILQSFTKWLLSKQFKTHDIEVYREEE